MGFGFGAGSDMMKAYKANKRQLKNGKSLQDNYDTNAKASSGLKFKEASEQEIEDFKQKFKEKQRKEKRKNLIVLGTIIIVTILIAIIVLFQ